jgi:hypothetical protein
MRTVNYQIAAAALAFLGATAVVAPAHAESIVEPAHSFDFVVDNGVCDFPVEWSGTTRSLGIDTSHGFITMSPNWTVTITNTETGTSWSPAGNGQITYNEYDDGTFRITASGVNSSPGDALLFKGTWTKTFYPDGTDSGWVGKGRLIDICQQLS